MTTSYSLVLANSMESLATFTGLPDAVAGLGGEDRHAGPLADHLQLGDRVGPLQVGGDQDRGVALGLEPAGQLAGQRGLTGALQTGEHDHRRRVLGEAQPPGLPAQDRDELLVDDLDDLLGRVQRLGDLGALGALADRGDERPDRLQRDVGLQQRLADRAQRVVDVLVRQPSLAAQVFERRGQTIGERVEHVVVILRAEINRSGGLKNRRSPPG